MEFQIENVTSITVICYLIAEIAKLSGMNKKWLPVMCGVIGGVLGGVAMEYIPQYPADNIMTAMAIGIVSGLAATGANQVYKQLVKNEDGK